MIQRIQSVYLLLSTIAAGAMYALPFGTFSVANQVWEYNAWAVSSVGSAEPFLTWPVASLIAIAALLNVVAIFLFKNRKMQNRLNVMAILLFLTLPILAYFYGVLAETKLQAAMQLGFSFAIPAASIVFTFLAFKAISKDEKLVRSLDRLR